MAADDATDQDALAAEWGLALEEQGATGGGVPAAGAGGDGNDEMAAQWAAMIEDGDSAAIVHAILSLAKALGMETTAEGIDNEDLALGLAELGCTYGQGFYYSEALTAEDALAYWLERNA